VRRSSSYYESLVALNAKLKAAKRPSVKILEADPQLEEDDLLEMANAALIPVTVVDDHIADLWGQVFKEIQVLDKVSVRDGGQIAWAVRKDSPKLLEAINAFVDKNAKGSATYNIVFRKYFQNTAWVKNSRSDEEVERFRSMIKFFQQYGGKYDFPWLLLAAQAFQESGIDQSRVSSAGAVGVMQIKPSTAEGPPVFIKGVDKSAQRNIEAGTKYLRFIADQLGKDEGMDKINRALFAFASYNAGPARVAQLRRKAEKRGLDPDKWFGNVELVAARDIGQETVQYVGNIYKYYVSYTLIVKEMEARERNRAR
jgi:membrane-bound lytic murein transglycosylase MltF